MKIRVIGDIHADYNFYQSVIKDCENSIQVGDFGIGFKKDDFKRSENHKFLRGNHDNPHLCKEHKLCIPDGTMHNGIFCVGGGWSIDRAWRTEGIDWWPEEELSITECNEVINRYEEEKPEIVISHEGPYEMIFRMFHDHKMLPPSRTSEMLEAMFKIHQPKEWYFGHWHLDRQIDYEGTMFRCLGITANSYVDIVT